MKIKTILESYLFGENKVNPKLCNSFNIKTMRMMHLIQASNQDFARRGGGLNQKLEFFCSKNVTIGWLAEQTDAI